MLINMNNLNIPVNYKHICIFIWINGLESIFPSSSILLYVGVMFHGLLGSLLIIRLSNDGLT
jgi:hypothetical protein